VALAFSVAAEASPSRSDVGEALKTTSSFRVPGGTGTVTSTSHSFSCQE